MSQKLASVKFSSVPIQVDNLDFIEEAADEYEEIDLEGSGIGQKRHLFRDQLKKSGGSLNHNLIKLKYEKKLP
jgi:hypothetical protein